MSSALKEHAAEAIIGLLVVLVAAWFVYFAWQRTGGGDARGGIMVSAQFSNAGGVKPGTDVRIAGLKVGTVTGQKLDPKTFQADVSMALDPAAKVPADSSAAITSEGIMGGTYIALIPGGDTASLKSGDVILDTQGSLDLTSLIGQFVNKSGGSGPAAGGSAPAPAPAGNAAQPTP
jgi:phospholipid/cholesterol/gamma-HCH transport system substrate-binding protein